MVLQANDSNIVAGWTEPGKDVELKVLSLSKDGKKEQFAFNGKADENGLWEIKIDKSFPKRTTLEIIVSNGSDSAKISNVVTGELWLGSGQSNMKWHFGNPTVDPAFVEKFELDAKESKGDVRIFRVHPVTLPCAIKEVCGDWRIVDSNITKGDVSQVCYIFASKLSKALDSPVGIINSSWGGSRIESWIPREAFENSKECVGIIRNLDETIEKKDFDKKAYLVDYPKWIEKNPTARMQKKNAASRPPRITDIFPTRPSSKVPPTFMYNAMINGIAPLSPRGVLWYQGESNASQPYEYGNLKKLLLNSWRKLFKRDFYFYYVELAAYTDTQKQPVQKESWGGIREAQSEVLTLPKTGVVTSIDNGGSAQKGQRDIHPPHKELVSERLANLALAQVYGIGEEKDAISPYYKGFEVQGDKLIVKIANANGLRKMKNVDSLKGFAIRGEDNDAWKWANAEIKGDVIILSNPEVPNPKAARYAWASWPLISVESESGLPLRPFSTDGGAQLDYEQNSSDSSKR